MKKVFPIVFLLFSIVSFGQGDQMWGSYFSYNNIQDIAQSNNRMFAASESAMFSMNVGTNEVRTITSVDGLKAETITAIHHSPSYGKTLIGNANGLLIILNSDFSALNKIDIVQETTVPAARKKINHIYEYEGKAYLSCDFGIAVFDLASLEFGDTYYLGPSGAEIPVRQTSIHEGYMYAATYSNGLRRAPFPNPNLNDFTQWNEIFGSAWSAALSFSGSFFGFANGTLYKPDLQTNAAFPFELFPSEVTDLREANGYMVATCSNRVNVYNDALVRVFQINLIPGENVTFTCATIVGGDIFIGTREKGVFSMPLTNISAITNITPNGPLRSSIFSIEKTPTSLWAVYGGYSSVYEPDYSQYGVSRFSNDAGWTSIPFEDLRDARSLSDITVNPANEKQVFLQSFHSGMLKVEEETLTLYNTLNSDLEEQVQAPSDPGISVRVNGGAFDTNGNLWITNSLVLNAIKKYNPGSNQWTSYSVENKLSPDIENYGQIVIDRNNTKWIASQQNGVVAFNETLNNKFIIIKGEEEEGNLPSNDVKCLAIDNNNRLWIGTNKGLRVISSIERFMTEDELTANAIIIMEDGLAQELMYEQAITNIIVDGGNNKWIGTAGAGAFLVSPDGQRTIFHFTKENSPLPSNNINDIAIDFQTGEVFFATDRGMVSYKGTSTRGADDLSKVYVFPNPVRPNFTGDVNISGLMDNVNIKITDIEGNLVFEATSEGGTVLWDTTAFGKYKVASGVYMIFIASEDGTETKVKKVMIIRG
ncbi:two-component regulator propeller domain-containing protein [uncultured Flavobacterium sp.]|uniref:type IX secretion system anionic LPS delivery protein PorZ n=1 Tax=uncultured Flavobacterium sp. TaxID=165435 RepID=UPI0025EA408D|nr:two-component regulator propeller domain-containing protein [uncultured Flavobacterium sp.]